MKKVPLCILAFALVWAVPSSAQNRPPAGATKLDRALVEVTIPDLEAMYARKELTVTEVTRWHLDRIATYDARYRSFLHVDRSGALAAAAAEDESAAREGSRLKRGPMWGVPIVIKANTSVKGLVTSAGWSGYLVPHHSLIAPVDATVVAKLRVAGAIILGQTNLPDFALGDTTYSSAGGRTGNAYNWRFSPGGSSGGTVTAIAADFAVMGTGTDSSNSIRMPSATSAVVGLVPTRGLVSTAGIHPLDWLLDNVGPIARTVTDAAIALDVIAGPDRKDFRTADSRAHARLRSYTTYLKSDALRGKRFGVPAFMLREDGAIPLDESTRALFLQSVRELRKAGASVIFDDSILPASFAALVDRITTAPYRREGIERFVRDFGPPQYRFAAKWEEASGTPLPAFLVGGDEQRIFEDDPAAQANFWTPRQEALQAYEEALDRLHLDGFVYPALQMPSSDETRGPRRPEAGPHSATAWVNPLGVPAIVVPAGYYANGLPFGLEFSGRLWRDGELLGWAFSYEHTTKHRKAPVLQQPTRRAR